MTVVLRWDIAPGKRAEAIDWAHRNASYRKKQPGVEEATVIRPLHGPFARIFIVTTFSSLTAWDEFKKKIWDDPEWVALRKETGDLFVPGSLEIFLYEEV